MKKEKSNESWKKELTPQEYHILREKGTEEPFTGKHLYNKKRGVYSCAACGNVIFDSDMKFDSHCGWPSFYNARNGSVIFKPDFSNGMIRKEVICANCGGHLGHIFSDSPQTPTGKRFCINSSALRFEEEKNGKEKN